MGPSLVLSLGPTFTICNLEGIGLDEFIQIFLQIQRCLGLGIHEKVWVLTIIMRVMGTRNLHRYHLLILNWLLSSNPAGQPDHIKNLVHLSCDQRSFDTVTAPLGTLQPLQGQPGCLDRKAQEASLPEGGGRECSARETP